MDSHACSKAAGNKLQNRFELEKVTIIIHYNALQLEAAATRRRASPPATFISKFVVRMRSNCYISLPVEILISSLDSATRIS